MSDFELANARHRDEALRLLRSAMTSRRDYVHGIGCHIPSDDECDRDRKGELSDLDIQALKANQ